MEDYERAAIGALGEVALGLEREAKIMSQSGGSHKAGTPTPATPGGPPAAITGNLTRSIAATPVVAGVGGWQTSVGAGMIYARALEFGNPLWTSGVRYPYMAPALKAFEPHAKAMFIAAFQLRWRF
jgi:hypothetical protein